MEDDIQKAVDAGKLTPTEGQALQKLPPGTWVLHKSWGLGCIAELNFLVNQMTIDFKQRKGHTMQLQYGAQSLKPIPSDHILALKETDADAVRSEAANAPTGLVRSILSDFDGRATQDQIMEVLVPSVFSAAEFKRWWDSTKKALKKDPLVSVPAKKSSPLELREKELTVTDEMLDNFASARDLKHKIAALDEIVKNLNSFEKAATQLATVVKEAEDSARKALRLHTSQAYELILGRDEILQAVKGLPPTDAPLELTEMMQSGSSRLTNVLESLPAAKQKRVIAQIPAAFGENWPDKALELMLKSGIRGVSEIARLLQDNNHHEDLRRSLDRWIRDHSITTEILYWLCKERKGEFADLVQPSVFSAILSVLERSQFGDSRRGGKLHDLVIDDRKLVGDLVSDAEPGVARDLMRRLMMTPVFEELNKRSLLARLIRCHPELETMMGGEGGGEKQEALIVSWISLQKRKAELEEIITKKIPENTKEISIAREYGDLRENFEFKAAKEMQRVLTRQRAELESALSKARGTDFSTPDVSQVSIGTVVTLQKMEARGEEQYSILGAWDSIPEEGVISYKTAIGQRLLGRKIGDVVQLPTESGKREVRIKKIEPYTGPLGAATNDEEEPVAAS